MSGLPASTWLRGAQGSEEARNHHRQDVQNDDQEREAKRPVSARSQPEQRSRHCRDEHDADGLNNLQHPPEVVPRVNPPKGQTEPDHDAEIDAVKDPPTDREHGPSRR